MNQTALIIENLEISWSAILIGLTIPAWFTFALALCPKKRIAALCASLPFILFFSFFFSRILYWYSHQSRFESLWTAIWSKDLDAFSILGIIPGIVLGCALVRLFKITKELPPLLDVFAAPSAFAIGFFYLTCRYHQSCLGRMTIENEKLWNLPFVSVSMSSQGEYTHRLAIYFFGFLAMMLIGTLTTIFYIRNNKKKGCTACFFLLFFSAAEFVLESARYDAGYFPFNGFVSIIQIAAAVSILAVAIIFLVRAAKRKGFKAAYPIVIVLLLASIGGTGYLEYLVQRHGDKAVLIHSGMCGTCLLMAVFPLILYVIGNKKKPYKIKKQR